MWAGRSMTSAVDVTSHHSPPLQDSPERLDNPLRAIAMSTIPCVVFAIADVTSKFLSTSLPIVEIQWIRYVLFLGMAMVLAGRAPERALHPRNLKMQIVRGLCVTGSSVLFVYGIREMTMAQATT